MILRHLLLAMLLVGAPLFAGAAEPCVATFRAIATAPRELKGAELAEAVDARMEELRRNAPAGVSVKVFGESDGFPLYLVEVAAKDPQAPRVFVSSGVHGSEPGAITTSLSLLEETLEKRHFNLTYAPLLNPGGLRQGKRRNLKNLDINRSFAKGTRTEASAALKKALAGRRFDVAVDLHGAQWKQHFFLISAKQEGSRADEILSAVPRELLLPSTSGKYPGYAPGLEDPEKYLLTFPGAAVSNNGGTVKDFLARHAPRSYTLEYPGQLAFPLQQEWNYRILNSILESARPKESR